MTIPDHDPTLSSRPYRIGLTVAILLFLLTLTAVIVLIIIGRARETTRESEFNTTLTAVVEVMRQTQQAMAIPATGAPTVIPGQYPFVPSPDSPLYRAAENCTMQRLVGRVLDESGSPSDAFSVVIWGDYTPVQVLATGELAGLEAGRWEYVLEGVVERRIWIQLTANNRYFSPPVELVLEGDDCSRNEAEVVFQQIAPLD